MADFETVFDELPIGPNSYLVIVTRGHRFDQLVLSHAVRTSASYIGLIGSRAKIGRIFRQLIDEGVPEETLKSVRAPIGLDVGAQLPGEIAVSIVSQLIACRRQGYLKDPRSLPGYAEVKIPPARTPRTEEATSEGNSP